MPSTDRKLELKAKTSMAQTSSQATVYAKGLINPLPPNVIYIYMSYRTANLQTLHFKYLFIKYQY
jgi:hypothetical protein